MHKFIISTDTTSDLPADFVKENNIDIHSLYYSIDDVVYGPDNTLSDEEFYKKMRNGAMPTTMACNPEAIYNIFKKRIEEGYDILHIAFSSALSCTYNNCIIAINDLKEEYPDAKIVLIDSLSASLGEGLIVYRAVQLKKEGKSIDEITDYINSHLMNFAQYFTVDDLDHLYRGGRISKSTALIGSLAGIKPVLYINEEGKLVPDGKVRGRKKALSSLVDKIVQTSGSFKDEAGIVFIGHSDCIEDAQFVADKIKDATGLDSLITYLSPIVGTHTGPGTVAVFFMAESRH